MNIHPFAIDIPNDEIYNDELEQFITVKARKVVLEHSLYTISLWEMKHNKCFLKHLSKLSNDEIADYIKCMSINGDLSDDEVTYMLSKSKIHKQIVEYLNHRMSATYIRESTGNDKPDTEAKTSELFYYYLIKLRAPVELIEHWHLSRLIALLSVFDAKDNTKHKRSAREIMASNDAINEARKKKYNTTG